MNFLINSGYELTVAEQELIVNALIKFQELAQKGNILADLEEFIPHEDTVDELFEKIASGQIWRKPAELQYIDRAGLLNSLADIGSTHDADYETNYAWIIENLENISNCMNRVNMLDPEKEPQQLQTDISIALIDDNRRQMYSDCFNILGIDSKIIHINKALESLIGKLLATEDSFITSCQQQLTVLLEIKEQHTFNKTNLDKLDKAIKHYGHLDKVWSNSVPKNVTIIDDSTPGDFVQDGTFMKHRKLNEFFINMNYLTGLKDFKKYHESLSWLMVNQITILDVLSNAAGGLDKLNADFPVIKTHLSQIHTQICKINNILKSCETELNEFRSNLSNNELDFTNAVEAHDAVRELRNTLDSMMCSVNTKTKQLELLTDLSKDLGKCKETYAAQTGRFFFWGCNHNLLLQFISDLNILIECNAEGKIGMLAQHINQNLNKHIGYTDLIPILKNFLEKAASFTNHSVIMEHSNISSPGFM